MAVDFSGSFLKCRKQHTNLKLRTFYLRLKTKQTISDQNCAPLKLIRIDQFRSHNTAKQADYRHTISAQLPTKLTS